MEGWRDGGREGREGREGGSGGREAGSPAHVFVNLRSKSRGLGRGIQFSRVLISSLVVSSILYCKLSKWLQVDPNPNP